MALITSQYTMQPGPVDLSTMGNLVHTAEMQYQRQMKTLQALYKQAEQTAEANAAWQHREHRRAEKHAAIDMDKENKRLEEEQRAQMAAEHRAARAEAAARHEEAVRSAAAARVQAVEERLARFAAERAEQAAADQERIAATAARREATYRSNLQMLEGRRTALVQRQHRVEEILRQREELRNLQLQIRAEEEFVREQQRQAIKSRAEAGLRSRVEELRARNEVKDEYGQRRREEIETMRRARAEELRTRFDYIAQQATEAAAVAEAERQALAGRINQRAAQGEALAEQRAALLAEMQLLRQKMAQHEDTLRSALTRMRQQGSTAIPEEVVRSLQGLQAGGPVRAMTMLTHGSPRGTAAQPFAQPLMLHPAAAAAGSPQARVQFAGGSPGGGRPSPSSPRGNYYLTSMVSPRVGQPQKARRSTTTRPVSASADYRRSATAPTAFASPAAGRRPATAATTPASAHVYITKGPYAQSALARRRSPAEQDADIEYEQRMDTSAPLADAVHSGVYTGVHDVARPGSRREEELRGVLQEEIKKEGERQAVLAQVTEDSERARLVKLFTMERENAKQRILALSSAAQAALYH